MAEVVFTDEAEGYLLSFKGKNKETAKKIAEKIHYCLNLHLFDNVSQCNKKPLKGSKKGSYRLHYARLYTVIYRIKGTKPNRYALIVAIMTIEQAHKKYGDL